MRTPPILAPLLALLLAASCGTPGDRARIKGEFKNISDAEFYLYDETGTANIFDTIQIRDGRFAYECLLDEPRVLTMLFPNFLQLRLVAEPGEVVAIKGDATQLIKTDIGGTDDNKALTQFRQDHGNRPEAEQRQAAEDFIRTHAGTHAATALFVQYFAHAEHFDSLTSGLIKVLLASQPDNAVLHAYGHRLAPISAVTPGTPLPPFTAVDMQGDTVRSTDYGQRPLLVLFWSSWNNACRPYAAAIRQCRHTYGQDFDMLTLSFEYSRYVTSRRVASDSLPGRIICDGKSFNSPLADILGVRYVPGMLLVDKERHIVARDLPADQLHDALGKLMTP